jgi:hypothetical protein
MRRLFVSILSAAALLISMLSGVAAAPTLADAVPDGCATINQHSPNSGNLFFAGSYTAGEVITVTTQNDTNFIWIFDLDLGTNVAGSDTHSSGKTISYTITSSGIRTFDIAGSGEGVLLTMTCSVGGGAPVSSPGCQSQFAVLSQVRVPFLVAAHWGAGKGEIKRADGSAVTLPLNANHDGKDTYLVIAKQTINGVVWVGLFLGSCDPAWLPINQVQLLYPLS